MVPADALGGADGTSRACCDGVLRSEGLAGDDGGSGISLSDASRAEAGCGSEHATIAGVGTSSSTRSGSSTDGGRSKLRLAGGEHANDGDPAHWLAVAGEDGPL